MDAPTTLPESWDEETDIVIVGFGGAGFAASVSEVRTWIVAASKRILTS